LYGLAYKHRLGWTSNQQNYILTVAAFYFNDVFDLRMCDKVLRDGVAFLRSIEQQNSCHQLRSLLIAQQEFADKIDTLIAETEETKNKN